MITKKDVQRVARTGAALLHNGGKLTVDHIIRTTKRDDWQGGAFQHLKDSAAERIAREFNRANPDERKPDIDPEPEPATPAPAEAAVTPLPRQRRPLALTGV